MPLERPGKRISRSHQLKIKISDNEKKWLEELALSRGLTSSDWLRLMLRDAYREHKTKGENDVFA